MAQAKRDAVEYSEADRLMQITAPREISGKYVVLAILGEGTDGCASLVIKKELLAKCDSPEDIRRYATCVKSCKKQPRLAQMHREGETLQALGKLDWIRRLPVMLHVDRKCHYIEMEWLKGSDLYKFHSAETTNGKRPLKPAFIWHFLAVMLESALFIRGDKRPDTQVKLIHKDIHESNIFVRPAMLKGEPPNIMIIDFGRSIGVRDPKTVDKKDKITWDQANKYVEQKGADFAKILRCMHELAHGRLEAYREKPYIFSENSIGGCECQKTAYWNMPEHGEFDPEDDNIKFVLAVRIIANSVTGLEIEHIISLACRQRDRAVRRDGPNAYLYTDIDWSSRALSDETCREVFERFAEGDDFADNENAAEVGKVFDAPRIAAKLPRKRKCETMVETKLKEGKIMRGLVHKSVPPPRIVQVQSHQVDQPTKEVQSASMKTIGTKSDVAREDDADEDRQRGKRKKTENGDAEMARSNMLREDLIQMVNPMM